MEKQEKITMIGLTENEIQIFLKLREIGMKGGWVKINFDKEGMAINMDEFKHHYELSTDKFINT